MSECYVSKKFVFFVSSLSREGNSVAAVSSSFCMTRWLRPFHLFSLGWSQFRPARPVYPPCLHFLFIFFISSEVLEMASNMVSFTSRSPRGDPCVLQVCINLSHAFIISLSLSICCWTPYSSMVFSWMQWFFILLCLEMYLSRGFAVFIPSSCSILGHWCSWASFRSSKCRWAGNWCSFWIQLVNFVGFGYLLPWEGVRKIIPPWIYVYVGSSPVSYI